MAGDWIPMRVDLTDDPAVILISSRTGIDPDGIVGKLHRLWAWANRHLENGNAVGVTEAWLDRYVSVAGFATAMREAGWLDIHECGFSIPNYDNWNSKNAKKRLLTAKRVALARVRNGNAGSVTEALPEKRREEKRVNTPLPPVGGAAELMRTISEVTGLDASLPAAERQVSRAAMVLAGAVPPYTPDDVRLFAGRFGELCPWGPQRGRMQPTTREIEKYIGKLRSGNRTRDRPRKPVMSEAVRKAIAEGKLDANGQPIRRESA